VDLPTRLEANYVCNLAAKVAWTAVYIAVYGLRPIIIKPKPVGAVLRAARMLVDVALALAWRGVAWRGVGASRAGARSAGRGGGGGPAAGVQPQPCPAINWFVLTLGLRCAYGEAASA